MPEIKETLLLSGDKTEQSQGVVQPKVTHTLERQGNKLKIILEIDERDIPDLKEIILSPALDDNAESPPSFFVGVNQKSKCSRIVDGIFPQLLQLVKTSDDEYDFLGKICNLLVIKGGYTFAGASYGEISGDHHITMYPDDKVFFENPEGISPIISTGKNISKQVLETGILSTITNIEENDFGVKSGVSLPFINDKYVFGTLNVYSNDPLGFSKDELHVLQSLANMLVNGIQLHFSIKYLRNEIEKFHQIIDSAQDAIIVMDEERKIQLYNKATKLMFGIQDFGRILSVFDEQQKTILDEQLKKFNGLKEGNGSIPSFELQGSNPENNGEFPVELTLGRCTIAHNNLTLINIRDITLRKEKQRELEKQKLALLASKYRLEREHKLLEYITGILEPFLLEFAIKYSSHLNQIDQLPPLSLSRNEVGKFQEIYEIIRLHSALKTTRALFINASEDDQIFAKNGLGETGLQMDIAESIEEGKQKVDAVLASPDQKNYDIICSNPELLEALRYAKEKIPSAQTVLITDPTGAVEYVYTLEKFPFVQNIITRNAHNLDFSFINIISTFEKLGGESIFGLNKYIIGGTYKEFVVSASYSRESCTRQFESDLEEHGIRKKYIRKGVVVAEEFMMNGVYDAPADKNGNPLYNHLPRTESVELKPEEQGIFAYQFNGHLLGISYRDPFGRFTQKTLEDYLKSCYEGRAGELNIKGKKGGAGRGLFQVMESADLFIINVSPGKMTEMIALFDISKYSAKRPPSLSFNFFEQPGFSFPKIDIGIKNDNNNQRRLLLDGAFSPIPVEIKQEFQKVIQLLEGYLEGFRPEGWLQQYNDDFSEIIQRNEEINSKNNRGFYSDARVIIPHHGNTLNESIMIINEFVQKCAARDRQITDEVIKLNSELLLDTHNAIIESDRYKLISQTKILSGFPPLDLLHIINNLEEKDFPVGSNILEEGKTSDYVYFLDQGRVEIIVGDEVVGVRGKGDTLGEMSGIDRALDARATATVKVIDPCKTLCITRKEFINFIDTVGAIREKLNKLNINKLQQIGVELSEMYQYSGGMIKIDQNGIIERYSHKTSLYFGDKLKVGGNIAEIIFEKYPQYKKRWESMYPNFFNHDGNNILNTVGFEGLIAGLPEELSIRDTDGNEQYLSMGYRPRFNSEQELIGIFITIDDMTSAHELERSMKRNRTLTEVVKMHDAFQSLLSTGEEIYSSIIEYIKNPNSLENDDIDAFFRKMHGFKGISENVFHLTDLKNTIQIIEMHFKNLRDDITEINLEELQHLATQFQKQFKETEGVYQGLGSETLNRLTGISLTSEVFKQVLDSLREGSNEQAIHILETAEKVPARKLFSNWPKITKDLSTRLGKSINVRIESGENISINKQLYNDLNEVLIHILRNSVDHGIINEGTISVTLSQLDDNLRLIIEDNGKGIIPEKILKKAKDLGSVID